MNGVGEEGFAGAGFAEQNHRHIGRGGESGEAQATLHRVVRSRQVFNFKAGEGAVHNELLAHVLAQLADRFEGVFDHGAAADDDARFAAHPDTQGEVILFRHFRVIN